MQAEILLTLKLQQRLFADPRRIALLKQIDQTGSISQGAKHAGISYKSAWDAINEMNQLSEQPLVDRATGGKGGGGAVLTRYGQRLIQLYDLLAQIQQKAFDVLSDDDTLPLDSLAGGHLALFPADQRPQPVVRHHYRPRSPAGAAARGSTVG